MAKGQIPVRKDKTKDPAITTDARVIPLMRTPVILGRCEFFANAASVWLLGQRYLDTSHVAGMFMVLRPSSERF